MTQHLARTLVVALAIALSGQAAAAEWNVSLWGERRASTEHVHKLAELVETRTGGEFTLNIDYGGLSKSTENLDGISLGAFEMAQFCVGYNADKNPTLTVLELPFLGGMTLHEQLAVSRAVYEHPSVQKDIGRWSAMLLMPTPVPQFNIAGTGEPPLTLDAFKGMRVRAMGELGEALEAVGAVPTSLTAPEIRDAMATGVVDAVAFAQDGHLSFGTIDLADWWTANLDLGTVHCPIAVNIDAYEALSSEHREALMSSVDEAMEHYLQYYDRLLAGWDEMLEEKGVRRVTIPDGELARFRQAAAPVRDRWIGDRRAQGMPGQELYELVQSTLLDLREGQ